MRDGQRFFFFFDGRGRRCDGITKDDNNTFLSLSFPHRYWIETRSVCAIRRQSTKRVPGMIESTQKGGKDAAPSIGDK